MPFTVVRYVRPVHGVHITEHRVLFDTNRPSLDTHQGHKTNIIEIIHLVDDEGVVPHENVSPDDDQVGEHGGQGAQALDAIHEQVAVDLPQLREGDVGEVLHAGIVNERNMHEPFHDGAVVELVEVLHGVPNVHALAHFPLRQRQPSLGADSCTGRAARGSQQQQQRCNPK